MKNHKKFISKFKRLFKLKKNAANRKNSHTNYIPGKNLLLNKKSISRNALKTIKRLNTNEYEAYLVGGGVRDLLLKHEPKDFDIATNATPEQIRKLFRNCRLIGRRFRLAHIYFHREIIEVATFRANNKNKTQHYSNDGMLLRDNVYGTLEQDAWRRDFTINALYYDIKNDTIIDFTNGLEDIAKKQIRIIGDANTRYREDPVRMLRAIRFAGKLNFDIEDNTQKPFSILKNLLQDVPPPRLFEETLKLFFNKHAEQTYKKLVEYNFFTLLFPMANTHKNKFLNQALKNTDSRLKQGKSINPAFLFSVILWEPLQDEIKQQEQSEENKFIVRQCAMENIIQQQLKTLSIHKRFTNVMKTIWELQFQLPRRTGKRAFRTLSNRSFRAAYDFLLLRAEIEPKLKSLADWWTTFQIANKQQQQQMVK